MINNIFENLTNEERNNQWMYMIFNKDKIKAKTERWAKEAEKAGMTLTEYLESINPLNEANKIQVENMSKEKKIQEHNLIDELSKMPPMVIETAYLYAVNYIQYGENVTEKWVTAVQNASILEKAYRKGYYDALQNQVESEE